MYNLKKNKMCAGQIKKRPQPLNGIICLRAFCDSLPPEAGPADRTFARYAVLLIFLHTPAPAAGRAGGIVEC